MVRAAVLASALLGATLALRADTPKPVTPFDGTTFKGWDFKTTKNGKSHWMVGVPAVDPNSNDRLLVRKGTGTANEVTAMVNERGDGVDVFTKEAFDDCLVELEFLIPRGSRSAVYLLGEYGVRVADNSDKDKLDDDTAGAIVHTNPPKANGFGSSGQWQKLAIEFQAPKFDKANNDVKRVNARFLRVTLNGVVVQENVEVKTTTAGGLTDKELPGGPLMLQGSRGPVAFRAIRITPRRG